MKIRLVLMIAVLSSAPLAAHVTVFKGRPSAKISEGETERIPEPVSREKAINLEVVINVLTTIPAN